MPSYSSAGLWLLQLMHRQESYCGGIDSSIPIIGVRGLHRCLKLADKTLGEPERLIRVKPERRAGSQARPNRLRKDRATLCFRHSELRVTLKCR